MTDLAARIEAATEGSRELSNEVLRAVGWKHRGAVFKAGRLVHRSSWEEPDGYLWVQGHMPHPTGVFDAAYALIGEGWTSVEMRSHANRTRFTVTLSRLDQDDNEIAATAHAATPALALSAALVRATNSG